MAHFLDGNILASMDMHLLGIPTLVVIFYRIIDLIGKHRTRTLYLNQRIK